MWQHRSCNGVGGSNTRPRTAAISHLYVVAIMPPTYRPLQNDSNTGEGVLKAANAIATPQQQFSMLLQRGLQNPLGWTGSLDQFP